MSQPLTCRPGLILAASVALVAAMCTGGHAETPPAAPPSRLDADPATAPTGLRGIYFVLNAGQWSDAETGFALRSAGVDIACRTSSLAIVQPGVASTDTPATAPVTLTVSFPGSHLVAPRGIERQSATFNYCIGDDASAWVRGAPSFRAVLYENLYDGIDLHVTATADDLLKYEFHVAPGIDPSQIRVAYEGADPLCIDAAGNMHVASPGGTFLDSAPRSWQNAGDDRIDIKTQFELVNDSVYRFRFDDPIDAQRELIIDPEVQWMLYLGGSHVERAYGVAVDPENHALVVGNTQSIDFAGRNNRFRRVHDAFLAKISPEGELEWMTYLGGWEYEIAHAVTADADGNIFVTGFTDSDDFPGRNNSYSDWKDAFALKVSPEGELQWMTYLGGSLTDYGYGIELDGDGAIWVTGLTVSSDFPRSTNSRIDGSDAFALKISTDGELQWMTYLGGSASDSGHGIVIDSAGNALIAGITTSVDFQGRLNEYHDSVDAHLTRVDTNGAVLWMTYLGGSGRDEAHAIAIDHADNVLLTGFTESNDFEHAINHPFPPIRGDGQNIFALRVDSAGTFQWMRYIGSRYPFDQGRGIAVDEFGNAFVAGEVIYGEFPGRTNAPYSTFDAILIKISPSGALLWSHYLGGAGPDHGTDVAMDSAGHAYVTGYTKSSDFHGALNSSDANGSFNSSYGDWDVFIAKVGTSDSPLLFAQTSCPARGPIRIDWSRATPQGEIILLYGLESAAFTIPHGQACGSTVLGINRAVRVVATATTSPSGKGILHGEIGAVACGGYFQLLDLSTCTVSNVIRVR